MDKPVIGATRYAEQDVAEFRALRNFASDLFARDPSVAPH